MLAGAVWVIESGPRFPGNYHPGNITVARIQSTGPAASCPTGGDWGSGRGPYITLDYETAVAPDVEFVGEQLYIPKEDGTITIFNNDAIDFTDLSINVPTGWDWDFETAGTTTDQNPTAVTFTSGASFLAYDIELEASNAGGTGTETKADYVVCFTTDYSLDCTVTLDAAYVETFPPNDAPLAVTWDGVIETITFDFDDGSTTETTFPTVVHTYETWGTFTVEVTVANDYATATDTTTVVVVNPTPDIDFVADTTEGVAPLTVTFTFSQTGGYPSTAWLWDFGDNITADVENPVHVYTTNGTYTVVCTATQRSSTDSETKVDYITVNPSTPDQIDMVFAPTCGYVPFQVDFQMLNVGPGGAESLYVTKEWDFGDGSPVNTTEENPSHVYVTATTSEYLPVLTLNKGMGSEFVVSASTGEGVVVLNRNDWGRFIEELGWHLFQRYTGELCDAWELYGGIDKVIDSCYDRYSQFLLLTGIRQIAAAATTSGSNNVWTLPADLVELRRLEADGVQLDPIDPREADLYDSDWETAGTEVLGYIFEPQEGGDLTVQIVPKTAVPSAVNVLYVAPAARPTEPTNCGCDNVNFWDLLDLPYVYWWIIRYGVIADLLRQEGEMLDTTRAVKCEEQWTVGIELVKALQSAKG
jgi:PKD repeat protein